MTQPLAISDQEQFQLPDVHRLGPMPSLPAWADYRVASLKTEHQRNPATGTWERMPVLPANLVLTPRQRVDVQRHVQDLRALCMPSSDAESEQRLMGLLTEFVSSKPTLGQNAFSAEALGASFFVALNDLPIWSVEKAIIRFHRGDWGKTEQGEPYTYRWCPASADLRRIAYTEMCVVKDRAALLERLLRAVAPEEYSEEHRAMMLDRLLDLQRQLSTPPVGIDGSGGAAGRKPAEGAYCGTRPEAQPGLKREGGRRRRGDRRK
jgi:hypothetical protein